MSRRRNQNKPEPGDLTYPTYMCLKRYVDNCRGAKVQPSPELVAFFKENLEEDTNFHKIVLSDREAGGLSVDALISSLVEYTDDLRHIAIWQARAGDFGCQSVANYANLNEKLASIELIDVGLGVAGCVALSAMLQTNATLKRLVLDFNEFGDDGIEELSKGLKWNTTLTALSLQFCALGPDGGKCVSDNILKYTSLKEVNLTGNALEIGGVAAVLAGLPFTTTLTKLVLADNRGAEADLRVYNGMQGSIIANASVTYLDLSGNIFTDDAATLLLEAFRERTDLVTFKMPSSINQGLLEEFIDVHMEHVKLNKPRRKKKKAT